MESCNTEACIENQELDQGVNRVCVVKETTEMEEQPLAFRTEFLVKLQESQNSKSDYRDWLCKPLLGGGFLLKCKLKDLIIPNFTVCSDRGTSILSV